MPIKPPETEAPTIPEGAMTLRGRANFGAETIEGDGAAKKKARSVEIVAYTGGPLDQGSMGWGYQVIIDLEGLDAGNGVIPLLDNHGPSPWSDISTRTFVAGQSNKVEVVNNEIHVKGNVFDVNECGKNILALADANFEWQASIGAKCLQKDFIAEGNTVQVNGKEFPGPVYVSRKTLLREVSFVVIGADANTEVVVASGGKSMTIAAKQTFAEYCKAEYDTEPDKMSEKMKAKVKAEFDKEDDDDDDDEDDGENDAKTSTKAKGAKAKAAKAKGSLDITASIRAESLAETRRVNNIRKICAANPTLTTDINGASVNILEHAIEAGWDKTETELAVLREERKGVQAKGGDGGSLMGGQSPHWYSTSKAILNSAVVEAALMQASGSGMNPLEIDLDSWKKPGASGDYVTAKRIVAENKDRYPDQVQQAARDHFGRNGISLHDILRISASYGGHHMRGINRINDFNLPEILQAAFHGQAVRTASRMEDGNIRADGSSTVSLSSVLANVLNKYLGFGYIFTDASWRQITSTNPTKDFKPTLTISLTGDFVFKKLGSNGEIPAAALTDEAYANQISTFARKLNLARQTLIDDDTSSLTLVPKLIGIGAMDAISITLWTLWLTPGNWASGTPSRGDGQTFWYARTVATNALGGGACNTNVQTGAGSALSATSLQTAFQQQMKQVKPNGQPLGVPMNILLIPPELDTTARQLMASEFTIATGLSSTSAAGTTPSNNIWKGRYDMVVSPYLSNSNITNYSTTAWWNLSDPGRLSAIEARFLNGQETPTVLNVNLNNLGNELGISIIGFLDFGVAMQNPRAGQKSNGA